MMNNSELNSIHKKYMKLALNQAKAAANDVPVGAVIVKNDKIIAVACNNKEKSNDVTGHAEILAIQQASQKLRSWRLENTTLYVTLEPCPMCAAAILYSRISCIVFGAYEPIYGALGSTMNMQNIIKFQPQIIGGIMEEESKQLLKTFFEKKR